MQHKNTYTQTTSKILVHNTKHFFPIFYYQNQKGTSNKFCPRDIFFHIIPTLYLYFIIIKKKQAINVVPEIFSFI